MEGRCVLALLLATLLVTCGRDASTGVLGSDISGRVMPAATPAGTYAYVANFGSNTVSVIRAADNTVIATVNVGARPTGVAATPNGAFVYVTNYDSHNVSVIRTSDNTVVATINVGACLRDVAITPNGAFAYVTSLCSESVAVIRTSDNTVIATIHVENDPYTPSTDAVAITPNGAFAYVTGPYIVWVIRTSDNTVTATVDVDETPHEIAITQNGAFAYVANHNADKVSVIRTSDNTVIATIELGDASTPWGISITPSGAFAYVASSLLERVFVIRTSDNTVIAVIEVGDYPTGVALTPGGTFAYVANRDSDNVSVIRTSDNTVAATVNTGDKPTDVAIADRALSAQFGVGWWETHQEAWPGFPYEPEAPAERFFGPVFPDPPDPTLLEVLKLRGGGISALGRQATAALLNSAADFVEFPLTPSDVTETFACAVESRDLRMVERVKDWFEFLNEGSSGREAPPNPCVDGRSG
jgi:YVTN family beta-propeller protein